MSVLKMQKITLCAMKKHRKKILEALQSYGVVEIISNPELPEGFSKMDTTSQKYQFEKTAASVDQSLEVLDKYAPADGNLLSSLAGREFVDHKDFDKAMNDKNLFLSISNEIIQIEKTIAENQANIVKETTKMDNIRPWISMDIPMNTSGTESTDFLIGTLDREATLDDVYKIIAIDKPDALVDVTIVSSSKNLTCIVVVCLKKDSADIENALRLQGFARAPFLSRKTPERRLEVLKESIAQSEENIKQAKNRLVDLAVNRKDLQLLSDYFRIRAEKYDILGELAQSTSTFLISGYIPERNATQIVDSLNQQFEVMIAVEDIPDEEEAPTQLTNNAFSVCTEGIVTSYGLPQKGELDPTTITSFFYVFLFGMMFADAAYGAILAILCGVALAKFKTMEDGLKNSLKLFCFCGISTAIWGLLFGGFFGDVITVVGATFFNVDIAFPALWFAPLDQPMRLLIWSLLFGLIHLFTGLGIKGYLMIREGKYLDCLYDVGFWFLFLIGLILMLIPSSVFASIAGQQYVFPEAVNMLAKIITIVGLVGIILMSGRRKKNIVLRLLLGLYDIYGITSWLSDILSYSRLLALGLASGVIAQVVNSMASMMGGGIGGAIFFIIVFIIGHTLNIAINLLGTYVHTNRLQYVEFFGKFYEGGGRPFTPFKQNTKYVRIKEDI